MERKEEHIVCLPYGQGRRRACVCAVLQRKKSGRDEGCLSFPGSLCHCICGVPGDSGGAVGESPEARGTSALRCQSPPHPPPWWYRPAAQGCLPACRLVRPECPHPVTGR